ncbi:MAG: serine--tRNA ligase, partial [Patescibacteria group bacterium]
MLDIKFIRENPEIVKQAVLNKNARVDIDELLKIDAEARTVQVELEQKRAEQKQKSKEVRGESTELKTLKNAIQSLGKTYNELADKLQELMYKVPNIPFDDVTIGKSEDDNVVAREVGEKRKFDFTPKDYLTLAEDLDIIDVKTAAEVSGSRFGYLKGDAALLEFALIQFGYSILTDSNVLAKIVETNNLTAINTKPFVPVVPPVMLREEVYRKMARLDPSDDRYHIPSDDLWLVGSA